jgi:hypothetical protein
MSSEKNRCLSVLHSYVAINIPRPLVEYLSYFKDFWRKIFHFFNQMPKVTCSLLKKVKTDKIILSEALALDHQSNTKVA